MKAKIMLFIARLLGGCSCYLAWARSRRDLISALQKLLKFDNSATRGGLHVTHKLIIIIRGRYLQYIRRNVEDFITQGYHKATHQLHKTDISKDHFLRDLPLSCCRKDLEIEL